MCSLFFNELSLTSPGELESLKLLLLGGIDLLVVMIVSEVATRFRRITTYSTHTKSCRVCRILDGAFTIPLYFYSASREAFLKRSCVVASDFRLHTGQTSCHVW